MSATILVIEDNDQNLYLVTFILEKHGYQVQAARDGMEGVARAASLMPDLILLDIQLPGMDGYTIAQRLRKNPDLASVPIVAVTSYAMPGDREKALEAGCSGYIEKPINPDTFIQQIKCHLKGTTEKGGENHGSNTGR
jgi:two-component system cell cycle response regulator DivK